MSPLPSYTSPPVTEVALAVAFDHPVVTSAHLGHFWFAELSDALPEIEEQGPYIPPREDLGPPTPARIQLELLTEPPSPRLWAKSADGTSIVQLQSDWMAFNWRANPDAPGYPRWEALEEQFLQYWRRLAAYLADIGPAPIPTQCEVTYINRITAGDNWSSHGELDHVLTILSTPPAFLGQPETTRVATAFRIRDDAGEERGRLHVVAQPAFEVADDSPVLLLTLTARGAPSSNDEAGVLSFLQLGHVWIVEGFTALTTGEMHEEWGRDA